MEKVKLTIFKTFFVFDLNAPKNFMHPWNFYVVVDETLYQNANYERIRARSKTQKSRRNFFSRFFHSEPVLSYAVNQFQASTSLPGQTPGHFFHMVKSLSPGREDFAKISSPPGKTWTKTPPREKLFTFFNTEIVMLF